MSMPIIVPGTVTMYQAISDIITSVALEQTALAHILNAEGEKIQSVIQVGTPDEMLCVNKSVRDMVDTIARLELLLLSKLSVLSCDYDPTNDPCIPCADRYINLEEIESPAALEDTKPEVDPFL